MSNLMNLTALPLVVAFAAVFSGAPPAKAQDKMLSPAAEADTVFIPQAKLKAASARRAAKKPVQQNQTQANVAPTAQGGGWPNGASSINETYGDWGLNCSADKGVKSCTLVQAQVNKEGQRAFVVEMRLSKDGSSQGTILMPFGLKLDAGVNLKLDNQEIGQGLRFSTCLAQGCLLPVSFPRSGMEAIRSSKIFTVGAINVGNDQPVTINVSLNGFAVAIERALQLES
jgi:invasion protein IalB